MTNRLISVVIPTYRRPHLVTRAVQSALGQTYGAIEVIVVIDGVDDGTSAAVNKIGDPRLSVIQTNQNQGPAEARNVGVRHAVGKYIALLDDDDEWTSEKLRIQMQVIERRNLDGEFLISCRIIGRTKDSSRVWPERLYDASEDLSEYLLDRRSPFKRTGMIASGSLLFPRSLALRVPFPTDSVLEDYAWLLLCVGRDRTPLFMCPEPMFIYHINPNALSRNKIIDWRLSLAWARHYRNHMSGAAFSGLLASTTVWRAKRQGGFRALAEVAKVMILEGQPRAMHWFMLGGVALLPTHFADLLRRGMS